MLVADLSPPAMGHVMHLRGTERHRLADQHPPATQPAAARDPVLLDQAPLGHRERPGRAAVIVPVGVLAPLPGQQPDITGVGPVQRQVPADIGVAHDQVRP